MYQKMSTKSLQSLLNKLYEKSETATTQAEVEKIEAAIGAIVIELSKRRN